MNRRAMAKASSLIRATWAGATRRYRHLPVAALIFFAFAGTAQARYAAFVMDAATGETVFADHADDRNHPASLTKMMTLYLLFEDIENRKVSLRTPLKVTPRAERQPASRLGLRQGETITVATAIEALVIKSANDVAVTVAENLAPSEAAFAQRMTKKAQLLGMSHTVFRNASGLHHREQVSTARDLARLGLALQRNFPKYYKYFGLTEFTYDGQTIPTHNNLVKSYAGADGLKTGFIQASGFNVATSAERDGRRLIAVVMGGDTARWRDRRTAELLDRGFAEVAYASAKTPRPPVKPRDERSVTELAMATAAAPAATPSTGEGDTDDFDVLPPVMETLSTPIAILDQPAALPHQPAAPQAVAALPRPVAAPKKPSQPGAWAIQVGAYSERRAAEGAAAAALALGTGAETASIRIEPYKASSRTLYRARIVGLSATDAERACTAIKRDARPCMVLRP